MRSTLILPYHQKRTSRMHYPPNVIPHAHHTLPRTTTDTSNRLYSYGEYRAEDQEQMLTLLDKKVSDVYASCIGANEANIP